MQLGREQERGAAVAAAVAALVGAAGCGNCLVWSKSDAFVTAYQREAAAPHLVGYIVAAEADEALARPLRLAAPEARYLKQPLLPLQLWRREGLWLALGTASQKKMLCRCWRCTTRC